MMGRRGFTLAEVIVSIMGMTIIALGAGGLIQTTMNARASEEKSAGIYRNGYLAMERMTSGVRKSTFLMIPNNHNPSRSILAFSGSFNDDDDYYFDDTNFPRIDEDLDKDMGSDGKPGIEGYDDDGDGEIDEGDKEDEEELIMKNEDPLNGWDDDGDGNIDEDTDHDMNGDDEPGIEWMDDDGDGEIDEDSKEDDDEDGEKNEDPTNPIIYQYFDTRKILIETFLQTGASDTLCTDVEEFTVTYYAPDAWHAPRIYITLRISDDDGEEVAFGEWVYPENIIQKCGKRVR